MHRKQRIGISNQAIDNLVYYCINKRMQDRVVKRWIIEDHGGVNEYISIPKQIVMNEHFSASPFCLRIVVSR